MFELRADWRLECRDARIDRGRRTVLDGVNLRLAAGESVFVIGPNGAGKSTLMLALLGLIAPTRGSIQLDGVELAQIPQRTRGRFASYVPQLSDAMPPFSVRDVVATGRYPYLSPLAPLGAADDELVQRAIDRCGLQPLAARPITELSAGERQKTMLAAALAQDAAAMFLDEPDAALDPAVEVELAGLLREWIAAGRGLVVISHDLMLPAALGGRVVALRGGRVVADGTAAEVLTVPRLSEIYSAPFAAATLADGRQVVLPRW
jgi:iron complex transport system ATP-binding protein